MSIKVFIADDHKLVIQSLEISLKDSEIEIVGVTDQVDHIEECFKKSQADVLLIDVRFDGTTQSSQLNGLEVCERILNEKKDAKIVVFSQFKDAWVIEKAYALGVLAFILKNEDTPVLLNSIKTASAGHEYFSQQVAIILAKRTLQNDSTDSNLKVLLSPKELNIFTLLADGFSVKEVSERVDLNENSIPYHIRNIKKKLNIYNMTDFTKLAIKHGLIDLELRRKN